MHIPTVIVHIVEQSQDELHDINGTTRFMIRVPGGCIALHPPLYVRLRRDPRCAATASDYVHAAIALTVFLSIVLVSPPVSLCLFPGVQPGTSSIRSVWSMFVPLVVTLGGAVAIALLDTPLRSPLGFGCCTLHAMGRKGSGDAEGAVMTEAPGLGEEQPVEVPTQPAEGRVEQVLTSSTAESSPRGSVVAVDVPAEVQFAEAARATEPLAAAVGLHSPFRTLSAPVFSHKPEVPYTIKWCSRKTIT